MLYATPIDVDDVELCHFYHVMDVPGHGTVGGDWDLRGGERAYLGDIPLAGRRVLEIGPASGFLTFHMESLGAEVVAVELGPDADWDIVPHQDLDLEAIATGRRRIMKRLRNGFWWAHARTGSTARVHYGDVYRLPDELGRFDVAVMAAVLLHTRNPLQIIDGAARVSDRIVITERAFPEIDQSSPLARFYPPRGSTQWDTWWDFSPEFFVRYLEVLGFDDIVLSHHTQRFVQHETEYAIPMFTVVAERTGGEDAAAVEQTVSVPATEG